MNTFLLRSTVKSFCFSIIFSFFFACGGGGGGGSSSATTPVPDTTPPVIASTNPISGATGIANNSSISVTFNEGMNETTFDNTSFTVNDGSSNLAGTIALSTDKKTAVFTLSSNMAYDVTHTVTVKSTVKDIAGNELGSDSVFTFTTGAAPDTTPPTVSVNPANGSAGFSVSGNIVLSFSEAMNPLTMTDTNIKLFKNGTTEINANVSYDSGTHTATINPAVDLDYSTSYSVKVYTGATDASGNAIASVFTSTFTSAADTTPPGVSSHVPLSDATGVAKGTNITITFSERLNASTVTASNITVIKQSDSSSVAGSVSYDDATKTVTFNPSSDLEAGPTVYTVTAKTGIQDIAGNSLSSNVSWNFTTSDGTGPSVSSHTPLNGSTGESVVNSITITFSEAINTSTLTTSNITIEDSDGNSVPGSFSYDSATMKATFIPTYNMNYQTVYTVTVDTGVEDIYGNSASGSTSWSFTTKERKWTVIYYSDADCDLESALMMDVAEMKSGYVDDQGLDLILLIDRHPGSSGAGGYSSDSSTLGEDFDDTRIYRITHGKAERISGGTQFPEITKTSDYEANMGDASTLKKFIQFCKANYSAGKYALILSNHGGGAKSRKTVQSSLSSIKNKDFVATQNKDICFDETSGNDFLYTSEISGTLTSSESVDLLGMDACLMSSVEFAYQFRNDASNTGFKASIMVASAPTVWGYGWAYTSIFQRLKSGGGDNGTLDSVVGEFSANEMYYDPSTMTAIEFGGVIVEEQSDSTSLNSSQSLTCIDLSKIAAVKNAVDALAVNLALENEKTDLEALRGSGSSVSVLHYFDESDQNEWIFYPYFDIYDLADKIYWSSNFSSTIKGNASTLKTAVDAMVIYSFGNSDYGIDFSYNKSGVHIFFPDGDRQITVIDVTGDGVNDPVNLWYWQDWYNSLDISGEYTGAPLGQLDWCIDGINPAVDTVGNWFELLDSWYDTQLPNDASGGWNYYQW